MCVIRRLRGPDSVTVFLYVFTVWTVRILTISDRVFNRVNSTIPIKTPAEGISCRRWCSNTARIGAESLDERTEPVRNGQMESDPVSWPLPFLSDVFMSGSAGHSTFSLCVCPSACSAGPGARETYIANPPSSATSRRENCARARHLRRWLVRKRAPRESPRDEDDAGTTSLRENLLLGNATRVKVKRRRRRRCPTAAPFHDVERRNNRDNRFL